MKYLYMIVLLFGGLAGFTAHADEWQCRDDSSYRTGNVTHVCGVGEGAKESIARHAALSNALIEFNMLCKADSVCRSGFGQTVPKRSECIQRDGEWVCYRLIEITITQTVEFAQH